MSNNTKLFIKVLRFISKPKFNALVQKLQTDKHYRKFFSYQHLLAFVFAQFNNTASLRELNWAMHMNCNLKLDSPSGKVLHIDSINLSQTGLRLPFLEPTTIGHTNSLKVSSFIYLLDMLQIYPTRRQLSLKLLMVHHEWIHHEWYFSHLIF